MKTWIVGLVIAVLACALLLAVAEWTDTPWLTPVAVAAGPLTVFVVFVVQRRKR